MNGTRKERKKEYWSAKVQNVYGMAHVSLQSLHFTCVMNTNDQKSVPIK